MEGTIIKILKVPDKRKAKVTKIHYKVKERGFPHLPQGYRFLEHTTDAEIEAYGQTIGEAFENAAKALEDTLVNISSISPVRQERIRFTGKDLESLLYSWLEYLIIKLDTEQMLFSKFRCRISELKRNSGSFELDAVLFGEKFNPEKHEEKTGVKAPTYHGMKILENKKTRRITLRFILDL